MARPHPALRASVTHPDQTPPSSISVQPARRVRSVPPILAALLAIGLLMVAAPASVLADAHPAITSITLDAGNHAVVTWNKGAWQGSVDVKWTTGDGRVSAPSTDWDAYYGLPLTDCYGQPLDGDPYGGDATKGQWSYGEHCRGQDVPDAATSARTWNELVPGVYYFQVEVDGADRASGRPCTYDATWDSGNKCLKPYFSGVYKLTVLPPNSGPPASAPGNSPDGSSAPLASDLATGQPGPNDPQALNGPGRFVPIGGGQVDVGAGGQTISNPPFNFDVRFGRMHLGENLTSFHCPPWTRSAPPTTTLVGWIGVRCRTVTTPQAAAQVTGTDVAVTVSGGASTFWVFAGQIQVFALSGGGGVLVGPGQMTTVPAGGTPSAPVAFDTADPSLSWWDQPIDPAIEILGVAIVVSLVMLVYFLPAIVALRRRPRGWKWAMVIDLLAGWVVIGWIAALLLAVGRPESTAPGTPSPPVSPDGRWWWDGQAWRPMPHRPPSAV